MGSELEGGLGWEGFFIHSKGDLAGWGRPPRGEGEGQSVSSRLEPRLMLGGAPADTGNRIYKFYLCFKRITLCFIHQDNQGVTLPEGEVGSPRSVVEEAGSVL